MMLYGKVLGFLMCMYQNILSFLDENIICGRSLICNLLLVSPLIKVWNNEGDIGIKEIIIEIIIVEVS